MRSNAWSGSGSTPTSWRRSSTLASFPPPARSMKRGSMSVTSTDPDGPTRSAIHAATAPLPPPTSRQFQPSPMPGGLEELEGTEVIERVEAREALRGLGLNGVIEDVGAH